MWQRPQSRYHKLIVTLKCHLVWQCTKTRVRWSFHSTHGWAASGRQRTSWKRCGWSHSTSSRKAACCRRIRLGLVKSWEERKSLHRRLYLAISSLWDDSNRVRDLDRHPKSSSIRIPPRISTTRKSWSTSASCFSKFRDQKCAVSNIHPSRSSRLLSLKRSKYSCHSKLMSPEKQASIHSAWRSRVSSTRMLLFPMSPLMLKNEG